MQAYICKKKKNNVHVCICGFAEFYFCKKRFDPQTAKAHFTMFFGPQMALAYRLDAISQGPKNSGIPGPNPLQLPHVMYIHASKTLCTGLYKSQVHK